MYAGEDRGREMDRELHRVFQKQRLVFDLFDHSSIYAYHRFFDWEDVVGTQVRLEIFERKFNRECRRKTIRLGWRSGG